MPRGNPCTIRRTLTDSRRRWLELLSAHPATRRLEHGSAPPDCARLGWCELRDGMWHVTDAGRVVVSGG